MMDANDYAELYDMLQDEEAACAYLQAALDAYQYCGNRRSLYVTLKDVIKLRGGITLLAKKANISRGHLSYMLSGRCNPGLDSVVTIFKAIDCRLQVSVRK